MDVITKVMVCCGDVVLHQITLDTNFIAP